MHTIIEAFVEKRQREEEERKKKAMDSERYLDISEIMWHIAAVLLLAVTVSFLSVVRYAPSLSVILERPIQITGYAISIPAIIVLFILSRRFKAKAQENEKDLRKPVVEPAEIRNNIFACQVLQKHPKVLEIFEVSGCEYAACSLDEKLYILNLSSCGIDMRVSEDDSWHFAKKGDVITYAEYPKQ